MFIEVIDTKGRVEVLNKNHIVKVGQIERGQSRFNMIDGSYVVTSKNIDDIWEELENDE